MWIHLATVNTQATVALTILMKVESLVALLAKSNVSNTLMMSSNTKKMTAQAVET